MLRRDHRDGGTVSEAVFSDDLRYRYALTRCWAPGGSRLLILMLNPSTADERRNDPTVARCEARARAMGQGALRVCNLFGYRATLPADLRVVADPVGPLNDAVMGEGLAWADTVLCAWGHHGGLLG